MPFGANIFLKPKFWIVLGVQNVQRLCNHHIWYFFIISGGVSSPGYRLGGGAWRRLRLPPKRDVSTAVKVAMVGCLEGERRGWRISLGYSWVTRPGKRLQFANWKDPPFFSWVNQPISTGHFQ
jgi:hypothetical protein